MSTLTRTFDDADRSYLIRITTPEARDPGSLHRALREDEDILLAMLRDTRMHRHLLGEPERLAAASPRVFFAVLLLRVRADLQGTTYTIEESSGHRAAIFDGKEVSELMGRPGILAYYVEMLVSFLRIRTQSFHLRLRRGMWSRVTVSDTDIESLLDWNRHVAPGGQFALWKRIGDLCLFRSSLYPAPRERGAPETLAQIGRRHYALASRHPEARELSMVETLEELGRRFETAAKPLTILGRRYLDALRERIFVA